MAMCYCRHQKAHMGQSYRKGAPVEGICMVLDEGARFLVRRGFAEERTVEQTLQTLDYARPPGLTHVTDNVREQPSFLCNCCRCCCELMAGVQMGFHDGLAKTPFIAEVDPELCDYCGECLRACNVKCVGLGADALGEGQAYALRQGGFQATLAPASFAPGIALRILIPNVGRISVAHPPSRPRSKPK